MTAPAGSEDAGLVLSAEDFKAHDYQRMTCDDHDGHCCPAGCHGLRATQYEHYADLTAARIARTPTPAGDAQGSQEASTGPVSHGDAGDGRGHGRDDESGRGAGL